MRIKPLLAIATFVCWAPLAWCDDANKAAKAEEYMRLAKMDETIRNALKLLSDQMKSGFMQQLTGIKVPPEMASEVEAYQDKVTHLVSDALSWEKLKPAYLKLYTDTYSEAELDGLVAFYKSPTGQALVEKSPALMAKATIVARDLMAQAAPELQNLMAEFMSNVVVRAREKQSNQTH